MNGLNRLLINQRLDIWASLQRNSTEFFTFITSQNRAWNVNHVQLSPTLQATKSNYTRAHKGKKTRIFRLFCESKSKANFIRSIAE